MDNQAHHAIKQTLVPSSKLKHELEVAAGTVLIHLTAHLRRLRGDDSSLPNEFVQAWASFGDHLTEGSLGQGQAFADAASACPLELVARLVGVSLHLGLIPKSLADESITQLVLQLNHLPEGEHHG